MPLGVFGIGMTELIILLACPAMLLALGAGVFAVILLATRQTNRSASIQPPPIDENQPDETHLP